MEGLAWLLIKMAVLLALAGATYFALGWWLRGRQAAAPAEIPSSDDIEQIKSAVRAAEAARDAAVQELATARSRLAAAELEVQRLLSAESAKVGVDSPGDLVLQPPAEEFPKPKAKRKPRAKKSKA